MTRIRLWCLLLFGVMAGGTAVMWRGAHGAVDAADRLERERLEARVLDAVENELSTVLDVEERRSVLDWRHRHDRAGVPTRSPLAGGAWPTYVVGYVEVDSEGTVRSPSLSEVGEASPTPALSIGGADADAPVRRILAPWLEKEGSALAELRTRQTDAWVDGGASTTVERRANPQPTALSTAAQKDVPSTEVSAVRSQEAAATPKGAPEAAGAAGEEGGAVLTDRAESTKVIAEQEMSKERQSLKRKVGAKDVIAAEQQLSKGAARRSGRESRKEVVESSNAALYQQAPQAIAENRQWTDDDASSITRAPAMGVAGDEPVLVAAAESNTTTTEEAPAEPAPPSAGMRQAEQAAGSADASVSAASTAPTPAVAAGGGGTRAAGPGPRRSSPVASMRVVPAPAATALDVEVAPFEAVDAVPDHLLLVRTVRLGEDRLRQAVLFGLAPLRQALEGAVVRDGLDALVQLDWGAGSALAPPFSALRVAPRAGFALAHIDEQRSRIDLVAALLLVLSAAGLLGVERAAGVVFSFAQRRQDFVAAVSHELKTPLTSIRMYAEMLDEGLATTDEQRSRYHGWLRRESERLGRLVDQVLELSRLERGVRAVRWEVGDVAPVLAEVVAALGPRAIELGFELVVRVEPGLGPVRYDRDAVMQIVMNLCDNAMKFGAASVDRRVEIFAERAGRGARVGVRDRGPGVPAGSLGRIFEPFYRGERELVRTTQGTGIGLSVVQKLCSAMGTRPVASLPEGGGLAVEFALLAPAS